MKLLTALILCLICLTACTRDIVRVEYIKPLIPELPAEPAYSPVSWAQQATDYCLDVQNAKNLLKNREIERSYSQELEMILKGLK